MFKQKLTCSVVHGNNCVYCKCSHLMIYMACCRVISCIATYVASVKKFFNNTKN